MECLAGAENTVDSRMNATKRLVRLFLRQAKLKYNLIMATPHNPKVLNVSQFRANHDEYLNTNQDRLHYFYIYHLFMDVISKSIKGRLEIDNSSLRFRSKVKINSMN